MRSAITPTAALELPDCWRLLPPSRSAFTGPEWTAWARALAKLRGDHDGFAWMEGLVDPEVQQASQQALEAFTAAADPDELSWPDEPISRAIERAAALGWPLTIAACTERATMVWVMHVGEPAPGLFDDPSLAESAMDIAMMTPGGGGPGPEPDDGQTYDPNGPDAHYEICHDLADWVDFGFRDVTLRTYDQQGVAVAVMSSERDEEHAAFGYLRLT